MERDENGCAIAAICQCKHCGKIFSTLIDEQENECSECATMIQKGEIMAYLEWSCPVCGATEANKIPINSKRKPQCPECWAEMNPVYDELPEIENEGYTENINEYAEKGGK